MFRYNKNQIIELANKNSFTRNTVEKELRLLQILEFINNSDLCDLLVLKGGTAINFCLLNLPRLSVDIDFDFNNNLSKEETFIKRKEIKKYLLRYMIQEGYSINDSTKEVHTLDSLVFNYNTLFGSIDRLKIEINYSNRCHVLKTQKVFTTNIFEYSIKVNILAKEELIATKINALILRTTHRDIYDLYNLIELKMENLQTIKKILILYLCLSCENQVNIKELLDLCFEAMDKLTYYYLKQTIIPVIHKDEKINIDEMIETVKKFLDELIRINKEEQDFINYFNLGVYCPELLHINSVNDIKNHPMAIWKANKHLNENKNIEWINLRFEDCKTIDSWLQKDEISKDIKQFAMLDNTFSSEYNYYRLLDNEKEEIIESCKKIIYINKVAAAYIILIYFIENNQKQISINQIVLNPYLENNGFDIIIINDLIFNYKSIINKELDIINTLISINNKELIRLFEKVGFKNYGYNNTKEFFHYKYILK